MKELLNSLFCLLLMLLLSVTPIRADLEVPGEANPLLAETTFKIAGKTFKACKELRNNSVFVKIIDAYGHEITRSESLGEQEKFFILGGGIKSLAVVDLNNDRVPEIIAPAMTGPDRSALYIFRFDPLTPKLVPLKFAYKKEKLERDFLVSDFYQENGRDLVFLKNNCIRVLGKIYRENRRPVVGFYFFDIDGEGYSCSKIVPASKD